MVIKLYVAMISCSQEVKKNQQRAVMILESKNIPYTIIDITDPANEDCKDYMVETAVPKEGAKIPVTPQIYNEADYCGDYDGLDMANECDTLGDFLKLSDEEKKAIKIGITGIISPRENANLITNGVSGSREGSPVKASNIPVQSVAEEKSEALVEESTVNAEDPLIREGSTDGPVNENKEESELTEEKSVKETDDVDSLKETVELDSTKPEEANIDKDEGVRDDE